MSWTIALHFSAHSCHWGTCSEGRLPAQIGLIASPFLAP